MQVVTELKLLQKFIACVDEKKTDIYNLEKFINGMNLLIEEKSQIYELIRLIYDPRKPFHIISNNVILYMQTWSPVLMDKDVTLYEILTEFSNRGFTQEVSLQVCSNFITMYPNYKDIILHALDKNLQLRKLIHLIFKEQKYTIACNFK